MRLVCNIGRIPVTCFLRNNFVNLCVACLLFFQRQPPSHTLCQVKAGQRLRRTGQTARTRGTWASSAGRWEMEKCNVIPHEVDSETKFHQSSSLLFCATTNQTSPPRLRLITPSDRLECYLLFHCFSFVPPNPPWEFWVHMFLYKKLANAVFQEPSWSLPRIGLESLHSQTRNWTKLQNEGEGISKWLEVWPGADPARLWQLPLVKDVQLRTWCCATPCLV